MEADGETGGHIDSALHWQIGAVHNTARRAASRSSKSDSQNAYMFCRYCEALPGPI
jgi:hypothetical protein